MLIYGHIFKVVWHENVKNIIPNIDFILNLQHFILLKKKKKQKNKKTKTKTYNILSILCQPQLILEIFLKQTFWKLNLNLNLL